jgi:hypothetical protein
VGRFGLAAVALVVGTALVAAIALELAGLQRILERIAPIWGELAPAVPVLVPLAGLASGVALLAFGVATLRRSSAAGQARAALGIGAATAALFVFVAHPLESAGEDPALFYRRIQPLTAGRDVASYGGLDFSPLWMLSRQRVEMLPTREDAEAEIAPRTEALLLIGEAREVAAMGRPCGARVLVRQPRPLGPELVLLEAFPEACPHPGPAAEARRSGR